MRRHLRQNATNVSEIYIGRPIYISDVRYPCLSPSPGRVGYCISDVQYIYRTSDIDIGRRI